MPRLPLIRALSRACLLCGIPWTFAGGTALDLEEPPQHRDGAAGGARPGLIAVYRSLREGEAPLPRVDAKPALFLGDGSLHPSLPPGPFEVAWSGSLRIEEAGPFRFAAFVRGDVLVEVDGITALEGRGESDHALLASKAPLDREPGLYPLKIRYRSPRDLPARLQIWWEGAEFSREPLPPWRLSHLDSDLKEAATEAELISRGRELARRWGCAGCHRSALSGAREPPPGPSLERTESGSLGGLPTRAACAPARACPPCSLQAAPASSSAGSWRSTFARHRERQPKKPGPRRLPATTAWGDDCS